jgi:hypothetical protein
MSVSTKTRGFSAAEAVIHAIPTIHHDRER